MKNKLLVLTLITFLLLFSSNVYALTLGDIFSWFFKNLFPTITTIPTTTTTPPPPPPTITTTSMPTTPTYTCTDSDGGKNIYVNGVCEDSLGMKIYDGCLAGELREVYCDLGNGNLCNYYKTNCPSGYVCKDGACVKTTTTTTTTCTDSDGGKNYLVKGTCSGSQGTATDFCQNNGQIQEFWCDQEHGWCASTGGSCSVLVGSGYICKNGACVKESITTTTTTIPKVCNVGTVACGQACIKIGGTRAQCGQRLCPSGYIIIGDYGCKNIAPCDSCCCYIPPTTTTTTQPSCSGCCIYNRLHDDCLPSNSKCSGGKVCGGNCECIATTTTQSGRGTTTPTTTRPASPLSTTTTKRVIPTRPVPAGIFASLGNFWEFIKSSLGIK